MIGLSRYAATLGLLLAAFWIAMAFSPYDRATWVLENGLSLVAGILLLVTHRRFPLSRISYTLLFVFGLLHTLGAHYTYAEVPYDVWYKNLTGHTLNSVFGWERNHYDRLVHFSYGLLLAYPIREVFLRIANVRGFWGYFLPLDLTMSSSMTYELIEWGAAETFGGELGMAYLGTQGDVWDAHKDMALASLGAILAMGIAIAVNRSLQRDFNREWADSLHIKDEAPLGEVAVTNMLENEA